MFWEVRINSATTSQTFRSKLSFDIVFIVHAIIFFSAVPIIVGITTLLYRVYKAFVVNLPSGRDQNILRQDFCFTVMSIAAFAYQSAATTKYLMFSTIGWVDSGVLFVFELDCSESLGS